MKLKFFLLCLIFFTLFCALGIWQLYRYQEKKLLLTNYQQQLHATPIAFNENLQPFQRVALTGYLRNDSSILIQNKFYQGKPGYEVLTPLQLKNQKKLILINRGWVPLADKHKIMQQKNHEQHWIGYVKWPNTREFILGNNVLNAQSKPFEIQKINIHDIERVTQQSYFPFIIRLKQNQPNGFVRDWLIVNSPPERHIGYAAQWFALAGVLGIGYLVFYLRRNKS